MVLLHTTPQPLDGGEPWVCSCCCSDPEAAVSVILGGILISESCRIALIALEVGGQPV